MHLLLVLLSAGLISSCSLKKMAIRGSTPLMVDSSFLLTQESNWDFFKDSSPGNLKFMELLYLQDKENLNLLSVLIKGHAGFAFGVPETLHLGEELSGSDNIHWKKQAIYHYTRAFDYGLEYLSRKGIKSTELLSLKEEKLNRRLDTDLGDDDFIAVLYMAQAWGSLINLQKDNVALVSQVPQVKGLFDWVCKLRPDIENGICVIFYSQYEASRPKMLGGDPVRAQELYQKAMEKFPQHLLIKLSYIQYLLLPGFEEEKYEKLASHLREEFVKWEDLNRNELQNNSDYKSVPELNLYNAIAKKRFEIIEKNKKNIF